MNGTSTNRLLSTKGAAEKLRISEKSVRRLMAEDAIEFKRVRGSIRIHYKALILYVSDAAQKTRQDFGSFKYRWSERDGLNLLTTREASKILCVSEDTVRREMANNSFEFVKLRGCVRVFLASLLRYMSAESEN